MPFLLAIILDNLAIAISLKWCYTIHLLTHTESDYEIDGVEQWNYHCYRKWDVNEQAWRVERRSDADGYAGFANVYYVPAGETIYATLSLKLYSGFVGTNPYGFIVPMVTGTSYITSFSNIFNNIENTIYGSNVITQFSGATDLSYNTLALSLTNTTPRSRNYMVGIYTLNRNASEGYYHKPDVVEISGTPYSALKENHLKSDVQSISKNYIVGKVTRIGGVT